MKISNRFFAILLSILMVTGLSVCVSADSVDYEAGIVLTAENKTIDATLRSELPAALYNTPNTDVTYENNILTVPAGKTVSFTFNAPKTGIYKVVLNSKTTGSDASVSVSGATEVTYSNSTISATSAKLAIQSGSYYREANMGRYTLNEGSNTLSFTVASNAANPVTIISVIIKYVGEHTIAATGANVIKMTDYLYFSAANNKNMEISPSVTSQNYVTTGAYGRINHALGSSSSEYRAVYSLNMAETGLYRVKLYAMQDAYSTSATLKVGTDVASMLAAAATESVSFINDATDTGVKIAAFETELMLSKGQQYLQIAYKNSSGNSYLYFFTIEKTGNVSLSETDEVQLTYDMAADTTAKPADGGSVAFQTGDTISYKLDVPANGDYKFFWDYPGNNVIAPETSISVDGAAAVVTSTPSTYAHAICIVPLTKGTHTVTFTITKASETNHTFTHFKVKNINHTIPNEEGLGIQPHHYNADGTIPDNRYRDYGVKVPVTTKGSLAVNKEQTIVYQVVAPYAGKYTLKLYANNAQVDAALTWTAYANENEAAAQTRTAAGTETANGATVSYFEFPLDLKAGSNTITVGNPSANNSFLNYLTIAHPAKPSIIVTDGAGTAVTDVTGGKMVADVNLNGSMAGKNIGVYFAVYETDANGGKRLAKLAAGVKNADDTYTATIDSIAIGQGCTYFAKVFLWDMDWLCGTSISIGE